MQGPEHSPSRSGITAKFTDKECTLTVALDINLMLQKTANIKVKNLKSQISCNAKIMFKSKIILKTNFIKFAVSKMYSMKWEDPYLKHKIPHCTVHRAIRHAGPTFARIKQSGLQSGPETAPLVAVSARYCNSLSHFKLQVVFNLICISTNVLM